MNPVTLEIMGRGSKYHQHWSLCTQPGRKQGREEEGQELNPGVEAFKWRADEDGSGKETGKPWSEKQEKKGELHDGSHGKKES